MGADVRAFLHRPAREHEINAYASDNPIKSGQTLAAGPMGSERYGLIE